MKAGDFVRQETGREAVSQKLCVLCGTPIPNWRIYCLPCEQRGQIKPAYIPEKPDFRRHKRHMLSTWDAGKKWGVTKRQAARLCEGGKVPGAYKENGSWYIPEDAEKPADMRRREYRHQEESSH